ncbi:MAG: hypothetical protein CSA50_04950 [Gammaproteobacteria bacterium]|nr:MAG: hypothetical protein CSA50_04950 [Gammaproteobacteria bacterium]
MSSEILDIDTGHDVVVTGEAGDCSELGMVDEGVSNEMDGIFDLDIIYEPTPVIEKRLGCLIRRYLSEPTKPIARSVVRQLEKLLCHPDCVGFASSNRCAYRKMLLQWRAVCL